MVCPAKYRRVVFDREVDQELRAICLEIAKRYEIEFLEIGTDRDHVHFLVQSGSGLQSDEDCSHGKKFDCAGGIQASAAGQG